MTKDALQQLFAGPYQKELTELAEMIDWLWAEHGKSFVKAGDDKVYAFGGNNYVLVFDESRWQGLIELMTPGGAVAIKPNESGTLTVSGGDLDEAGVKRVLSEGVQGIRKYYNNRYWSTPRGA